MKTTTEATVPGVALKEATKVWASKQRLILGTWSTPREWPDDSWEVKQCCQASSMLLVSVVHVTPKQHLKAPQQCIQGEAVADVSTAQPPQRGSRHEARGRGYLFSSAR